MEDFWRSLTHYQLLEVSRNATVEECKQQRDLMLTVWHPDKAPEQYKSIVTDRTTAIVQAFKVLSDIDARTRYDLSLPPEEVDELVFSETIQNVPTVWKKMAAWMAKEDVGRPFHRTMAYKAGDLLDKHQQPSDKQKKWMLGAWELAIHDGFDPESDGFDN
jgi:DnaJ-class molecular chaperone